MKKEVINQLTEEEMINIGGGRSKFSRASFAAAGVILAVDSIVIAATCSPVVGMAAMGTAIACIKASQDE